MIALAAPVLVAAQAVLAQTPSSHEEAPRILLEPASIDFGDVQPESVLRAEATIRNDSNREIRVDSVTTSCGCTAAILGAKALKPKETTKLLVVLHTRNAPGSITRTVLVRFEDTAHSSIEVKVNARVKASETR